MAKQTIQECKYLFVYIKDVERDNRALCICGKERAQFKDEFCVVISVGSNVGKTVTERFIKESIFRKKKLSLQENRNCFYRGNTYRAQFLAIAISVAIMPYFGNLVPCPSVNGAQIITEIENCYSWNF
jgi:hypothetical protein